MGGDSLERALLAVGFGAARTIPVAWFVPTFGGPHAPAQLRMGLGVAFSILALPRILPTVPTGQGALWWLILMREVLVGVSLGFVAGSLFRAAETAGRLIDTVRGANMAEVLSPVSDARTSPLGDLYQFVAIVIFLELGGIGHIVTALAQSYDAIPLAATALPQRLGAMASLAVVSSAQLLESAVGLAAPALVAMLLADLALGALGRLAPQVPLFFVGMPLKALGAVGVVLVGLGALHGALTGQMRIWTALVGRAVALWR